MNLTESDLKNSPEAAPAHRLDGWKEISNYLNRGVRTVQRWEIEKALPIHGVPDSSGSQPHKSAVYAFPKELDEWLMSERAFVDLDGAPFREEDPGEPIDPKPNGNGKQVVHLEMPDSHDPVPRTHEPGRPAEFPFAAKPVAAKRPGWRRVLYISALVFLLLAGYSFYRGFLAYGPPAEVRMTASAMLVFDAMGREIWRHSFPVPIGINWYEDKIGIWHREADLDLDGRIELLVKFFPQDAISIGMSLYCFSEDGRVKWVYQNRREVSDQKAQFSGVYLIDKFDFLPPDRMKSGRVVVNSNHAIEYPEQVAVLDADGKVVGEYWHSGHLIAMQVAPDGPDGLPKLFMAGVNNGYRQATLVVLDPYNLRGASNQLPSDPLQLKNMQAGSEIAIVRFPRSCISDLYGPFNIATSLSVSPASIEVVVSEDVIRQGPEVIYQLDRSLKVTAVRPSVIFRSRHRQLEIEGKLHHALTDQEVEQLKSGTVVVR